MRTSVFCAVFASWAMSAEAKSPLKPLIPGGAATGVRAYLMMIDLDHVGVSRILESTRKAKDAA